MPYSHGIAPYYDLFSSPDDAPDAAAAFVTPLLDADSTVLDIGAGTGTVAIALAERGFQVTAIEPDEEMHAVLLARIAARFDISHLVTPILRGADFCTPFTYDLVSSFAVLHLLEPHEQDVLLASARAQVAFDGRVVLEMPVESAARTDRPWSMVAARSLGHLRAEHHSSTNAVANGGWQTHWRFLTHLEGAQIVHIERTFNWRPLTHKRTEQLLRQNGLVVEGDFSGYDRQPYVSGASRVRLVVARAA